ncbi:MAG TPA: AroM family protein [Firmicutes bacterium]|nr:AroM family protein [Bacillota bacterium]
MSCKIGLITIGQAPRSDITQDIRAVLGDSVELVEAGALDFLGDSPVPEALLHKDAGKHAVTYVSRLRDGRVVEMTEKALIPLLWLSIERLRAEGVTILGLLCTGEYRALAKARDLIRPYPLIHNLVDAVLPEGHLGVIVPVESQVRLKQREWAAVNRCCTVEWASPYKQDSSGAQKSRLLEVARAMEDNGVELIVLDCLGFSMEMKEMIQQVVKCPVLLPRSVLAWTLRELCRQA